MVELVQNWYCVRPVGHVLLQPLVGEQAGVLAHPVGSTSEDLDQ